MTGTSVPTSARGGPGARRRRLGPLPGSVPAAEPSPGHGLGDHQGGERLATRSGSRPTRRQARSAARSSSSGRAACRGAWATCHAARSRPEPLDAAALDPFTGRVRVAARRARLGWVRMEPEAPDDRGPAGVAGGSRLGARAACPARADAHHRPDPGRGRRSSPGCIASAASRSASRSGWGCVSSRGTGRG